MQRISRWLWGCALHLVWLLGLQRRGWLSAGSRRKTVQTFRNYKQSNDIPQRHCTSSTSTAPFTNWYSWWSDSDPEGQILEAELPISSWTAEARGLWQCEDHGIWRINSQAANALWYAEWLNYRWAWRKARSKARWASAQRQKVHSMSGSKLAASSSAVHSNSGKSSTVLSSVQSDEPIFSNAGRDTSTQPSVMKTTLTIYKDGAPAAKRSGPVWPRSAKKSCGTLVPLDRRRSSSGDISWELLRNFRQSRPSRWRLSTNGTNSWKRMKVWGWRHSSSILIRRFLRIWSKGDTRWTSVAPFLPSKSPRKTKTMRSHKLKLKGCPLKWSGEEKQLVDGKDDGSTTLEPFQYPELMNILPAALAPCPPLSESILEWIEREYKSSRGFELGTFNPSILPTLFQELSMKWEDLAGAYVTNVIATVHYFCNTLLTRLCPKERVMTAFWSLLIDELLQRYRKVVEHVQFLLRTERSGNLLTTNHYFSETLNKLRWERSVEPIENLSFNSSNAAQRTSVDNMEHSEGHSWYSAVLLQSCSKALCRQFLHARNRLPSDHRTWYLTPRLLPTVFCWAIRPTTGSSGRRRYHIRPAA